VVYDIPKMGKPQSQAAALAKPLHGQKFQKFHQEIMNLDMPTIAQLMMFGCIARSA
jgi:hypothetical protein